MVEARQQSRDEFEFSMEDVLATVLAERSAALCLAVDRQPTLLIDGQTAMMDVAPVNAQKLEALLQSVASPTQIGRVKSTGCVEFIHDFETNKFKSHTVGRFRIEAKAVNGHVVLIKCHAVPLEARAN